MSQRGAKIAGWINTNYNRINILEHVAVCVLFFDPTGGQSGTVYSKIRYIITVYLLIRNVRAAKLIPAVTVLLTAFSAVMGISTWINTESWSWTFSGVMFGLSTLALFLFFYNKCSNDNHEGRKTTRLLVEIFVGALLINDMLMLILPYNRQDSSTVYLLGNKFIVSYAHCLFAGVVLVYFKERVLIGRCAAAFGALMSYYAGSSTGAIVCSALFLLTLLPRRIVRLISKPEAVVGFIALLNFLIWGPPDIFHNPFIQGFYVNVLGKTYNMTGREALYSATLGFVAEKPLLGWGYLTDVYRETFGYGNAQNGLFHLITQCGILGTLLYISAIWFGLKASSDKLNKFDGLYFYLYAMIIGSAIEINLSLQFSFGVALLCALQSNRAAGGLTCSSE